MVAQPNTKIPDPEASGLRPSLSSAAILLLFTHQYLHFLVPGASSQLLDEIGCRSAKGVLDSTRKIQVVYNSRLVQLNFSLTQLNSQGRDGLLESP